MSQMVWPEQYKSGSRWLVIANSTELVRRLRDKMTPRRMLVAAVALVVRFTAGVLWNCRLGDGRVGRCDRGNGRQGQVQLSGVIAGWRRWLNFSPKRMGKARPAA